MNNELILSTKGLYTQTIIPLIIYIVACVGFFYMFPTALTTPVGYVVSLALLAVFIKPFTDAINLKKSYIELYVDYITGETIPESNLLKSNTSSTFYLKYEDILNVEIQDKKVKIYFNGGSYLVQANGVETDVARIIQTRKNDIASYKNY